MVRLPVPEIIPLSVTVPLPDPPRVMFVARARLLLMVIPDALF